MKIEFNETETKLELNEGDSEQARRLGSELLELCSKGNLLVTLIYDPDDQNRVVDFVVIPATSQLAKQRKGRA